jgi:hypothetical protein
MADKKVSMKKLRDTIEQFISDIEGADVIRLDSERNEAGRMPRTDLRDALKALKAASKAASEICQQPVLAVILRKR